VPAGAPNTEPRYPYRAAWWRAAGLRAERIGRNTGCDSQRRYGDVHWHGHLARGRRPDRGVLGKRRQFFHDAAAGRGAIPRLRMHTAAMPPSHLHAGRARRLALALRPAGCMISSTGSPIKLRTLRFPGKQKAPRIEGLSIWSGRPGSNRRPSPWQGDALPLSHFRVCRDADSNCGHPHFQCGALPTELSRLNVCRPRTA
jgi:hypothetical protein